jgi:Leucine-rich repeat (LRR) protein
VPPALVIAIIDTSQVTSFQATKGAPDLAIVRVVHSSLSGEVPAWLLQAPSLQILDLEGNQLESMPQTWLAPSLISLELRNNSIQVTSFVLESSCLPNMAQRPLFSIDSLHWALYLLLANITWLQLWEPPSRIPQHV